MRSIVAHPEPPVTIESGGRRQVRRRLLNGNGGAARRRPPNQSGALPGWYPDLLTSVAQHVSTGHRRAVAAANTELLAAYWAIGREILDRQHQEGYGTKVIDRLSADLRERFPDAGATRPATSSTCVPLRRPGPRLCKAACAQLPWYHHIALLEKLDTPEQRQWCAAAALDQGWSRTILTLQLATTNHLRSPATPGNQVPDGQERLADRYRRLSGRLARAWALCSGTDELAAVRPEV
jgi:hypothetical protein